MSEYILNFIQAHSEWAPFIVFFIALVESLLIVGLFLPGWLLLVGIGGMIGADILSFYPIVISAYLGAVIGESLSFHLGYHYHQKILQWPLIARHQRLIDLAHKFFDKHGIGGVFIGRFFGPTRSVVPFIAGVAEMSKKTFFWVNCVSGLLWAPLYLIPGILIGAAFNLQQEEKYYLLFVLLLITIAFSLAVKLNKQYFLTAKENKSKMLAFKSLLSLLILLCMLIIFIQSPLWSLFTNIIIVLADKL